MKAWLEVKNNLTFGGLGKFLIIEANKTHFESQSPQPKYKVSIGVYSQWYKIHPYWK